MLLFIPREALGTQEHTYQKVLTSNSHEGRNWGKKWRIYIIPFHATTQCKQNFDLGSVRTSFQQVVYFLPFRLFSSEFRMFWVSWNVE